MDKKLKVLITGFAPFGAIIKNPSWEVTRRIRAKNIYHLCLPVDYKMAPRLLLKEIRRIKPDWVIGSGVHFGKEFAIETLARNEKHVDIALQGPWPMERLVETIEVVDKVHPTRISTNAGAWVCENVFWYIFRLAKHYGYKGGFIHVPLLSLVSFKIQRVWWKYFLKEMIK